MHLHLKLLCSEFCKSLVILLAEKRRELEKTPESQVLPVHILCGTTPACAAESSRTGACNESPMKTRTGHRVETKLHASVEWKSGNTEEPSANLKR